MNENLDNLNKEELKKITLEGETWADIPDFEGYYKISTFGRIYSLPRTVSYANKKNGHVKFTEQEIDKIKYMFDVEKISIKKIAKIFNSPKGTIYGIISRRNHKNYGKLKRSGQLRKGSSNGFGYLHLQLSKDGTNTTIRIHRLVAEIFIPNPNNLPEVHHKDGNKINNHISNLVWSTTKDNIIESWKMGLSTPNFGSANGAAKLTEEDVKNIRITINNGTYNTKKLAQKYGVTTGTINNIITKRNWKHI